MTSPTVEEQFDQVMRMLHLDNDGALAAVLDLPIDVIVCVRLGRARLSLQTQTLIDDVLATAPDDLRRIFGRRL